MSNSFIIDFTLDQEELAKTFQGHQYEVLIINNIPSVSDAFQLISTQVFKNQVNLSAINFKIHEKFLNNFYGTPSIYDFCRKKPIAVTFQSLVGSHNSCVFWKTAEKTNFFSLKIMNDVIGIVTTFCQNFLIEQIKDDKTGILSNFSRKNDVELRELGDEYDFNLLMIASEKNYDEVVCHLLKYGFDIDYENENSNNAIECAWLNYINSLDEPKVEQKCNKIILSLLNANSKFPKEFDFKLASEEVQSFMSMCEGLHSYVVKGKIIELQTTMNNFPNLCHFYDRNNQSLLAYAIRERKYEILELIGNGLSIGCHENLDVIYKNASGRQIRNKFREHAKELPQAHLFILRSKSKIGYNDRQFYERWKHVEEAFTILDSNQSCSKILKVSATCRKLKIYFDFMQDTVFYLDPTKNTNVLGTSYNNGMIYIGAKYLTDENMKYEVIGVLIHELSHLAVNITFMNDFNPFPMGDSKAKILFLNEVIPECEKHQRFEELVENALKNYEPDVIHSEIIVLVVQLLMNYYIADPLINCRNSKKITSIKQNFRKLFKYHEIIVESEMEKALPVLKIIDDFDCILKFENLTEPMKMKILHSNIIFQGVKSIFYLIIGDDREILKLLSSNQIRSILLNSSLLEIGTSCKNITKYKIIERNFTEQKIIENKILVDDSNGIEGYFDYLDEYCINSKNNQQIVKKFEEIQKEANDLMLFILADYAGSGKTTTFKVMAERIKESHENYWVSFINLRKHIDIFEKYQKRTVSLERIPQMLFDVLPENSELEERIFKNLLFDGKVILFVDGVDEISPKYNKFLMDVLIILRNNFKNQIWISTRPQHAHQMNELFDIPVHNFVPFTPNERRDSVTEILKTLKISDEKIQSKALQDFEQFFDTIEKRSSGHFYINNPLLIEIFSELYAEEEFNMNTTSLYGIFEKMIEKQKRKVDSRIEMEDRDPFADFPLKKVHHVYAIKLLISEEYEYRYRTKVEELAIIKQWEREEPNFTSEKIQRYGFLTVDIKDDRSSIDFIHRTYAEFFVAEFIICFIYKADESTKDEEFEKVFKIMEIIADGGASLEIVRELLFYYIKNELITRCLNVHAKMRELISEKFPKSSKFEFQSLQTLEFWSTFFIHEQDTLRELWMVGEKDDLLKRTLFECKKSWKSKETISNILRLRNIPEETENVQRVVNCLEEIFKIVKNIFGNDWHVVFNKNVQKLVTHEKLMNYQDDESYNEFNRNLLKLLDLIEKNYTPKEKNIMHMGYFEIILQKHGLSRHINLFIVHNIFHGVKYEGILYTAMKPLLHTLIQESRYEIFIFLKSLIEQSEIFKNQIEFGFLHYLCDKLEVILSTDGKYIRKILFNKFENQPHLLVRALESNDVDLFLKVKALYAKYSNSWKGFYFRKIFANHFELSAQTLNLTNEIINEFKIFVDEIFASKILFEAVKSNDFKTFEAFKKFYRECENILDGDQLRDIIIKNFHPEIESLNISTRIYLELKRFITDVFVVNNYQFSEYKKSCKFICLMFDNNEVEVVRSSLMKKIARAGALEESIVLNLLS